MAQRTKKLITECALRLAEKKPINKITVREIVEECELTRNTFYYHFHDIYDVFKTYLDDRTNELAEQADINAESALFSFIEICTRYKKVLLNLYKSLGHEEFSNFAYKKLGQLIMLAIKKQYDISKLSKIDIEIICTFYEEAIFGILVRWLREKKYDTPEDMKLYLERIRILFDGQLERMVDNCSSQ